MIVASNRWFRALVAGVLLAAMLCPGVGFAQEEKKPMEAPRITAIAPLEVISGLTTTLHIRGMGLADATALRFADAPSLAVELKEKKKADIPNGLDAKKVGDSQVTAEIKVPAELTGEKLRFRVVTPAGETDWKEIRLAEADAIIEEKEPDNGFREAQPVAAGKLLRGSIKEDKDVDVLRFDGQRGKRMFVQVFAARRGSLLDPILTLFDAQGQLLASSDDADESRDAGLVVLLPADGPYYVSVADAHDRGGAWHVYTLEMKEVQP